MNETAAAYSRPDVREIERTEIDGIPAFWTEAPGPYTGGLVFRVGQADERPTHSGITHLVEHLALPAERVAGLEFNGAVMGALTSFWASGPRERVIEFLAETATQLSDLPNRVDVERNILLTESATGRGILAAASSLRFGPSGYGLLGYPEFGLRWLGYNDARAWADEWFTRGNVALHFSGEPPTNLELPLLEGERRATPSPEEIEGIRFPCVYPAGGIGGAAVSFIVERSAAASMAMSIALERARALLRYREGLSYNVQLGWFPLTRDYSHGIISCDCREGAERQAAGLLRRVLEELAEHGPTEDELRAERTERRRTFEPERSGVLAYWYAESHVLDAPFEPAWSLASEPNVVGSREAADAAAAALGTALLMTQDEGRRDENGWSTYPLYSEEVVPGRRYRPRLPLRKRLRAKTKVTAGDEGITYLSHQGEAATVKFDDCVVIERHPDGARALWARDATQLFVHPRAWEHGERLVAWIDDHVADDRVVHSNPDVEKRVAALTDDEKITRELKQAAGWLEFDEAPEAFAEATYGDQRGVLVVTDRRVLFTAKGRAFVDFPLHALTAVRGAGRGRKKGSVVVTPREGAPRIFMMIPNDHTERLLMTVRQVFSARDVDGTVEEPLPPREFAPSWTAPIAVVLSFFPLSLFGYLPLALIEKGSSHVAVLLASLCIALINGGPCAAGIWLGWLGRRRARRTGFGRISALLGIVFGVPSLTFWAAMAILFAVGSW